MGREQNIPIEGDVLKLRDSFEAGSEWTKDAAAVHFDMSERRFRAAVAALRATGYPVVSYSEEGSTYRKAKDVREVDHFIDTELLPRMRKLEAEARAMRTLSRRWLDTQTALL